MDGQGRDIGDGHRLSECKEASYEDFICEGGRSRGRSVFEV
jgi:hypothetical protein